MSCALCNLRNVSCSSVISDSETHVETQNVSAISSIFSAVSCSFTSFVHSINHYLSGAFIQVSAIENTLQTPQELRVKLQMYRINTNFESMIINNGTNKEDDIVGERCK